MCLSWWAQRSRAALWSLDIFPCLDGSQSPLLRPLQSKEATRRCFVEAVMPPMNEAYSETRILFWTAVAGTAVPRGGQWSPARHRFGFECPMRIADPEPVWPVRAKAPSTRGTAVPRSAGALHKRYQCRLNNVQTPGGSAPKNA